MDLEAIPGIGEKTAMALNELEAPEDALRNGDIATLTQAPGVSANRAVRLVRAAQRTEYDDTGTFLATDRAQAVYHELLEILKANTVTEYGALRIETLFPSSEPARIEAIQELSTRGMARDPDPAIREELGQVRPITEPAESPVRDRCIATMDAARYSTARDAFPELSIELVEDARGLAELARSYSTVIALDESFAGLDVPGDIRIMPDALDRPTEIVPERVLAFFAANRESLQAAITVVQRVEDAGRSDLDSLATALTQLTPDGTVRGDDELERLTAAVDNLNEAASSAAQQATNQLRAAIRDQDVTIEGTDLLSLVEQGAGIDSLLAQELTAEYDAAIAEAHGSLVDSLALSDTEADTARELFPSEPTYPVEADESVLTDLRETMMAARDQRGMALKRDLAVDLVEYTTVAETVVQRALELDVEFAIARFANEYDCTMPEFTDRGLAFSGGRSPLLDEPRDAVEPVSYQVRGVTVLSGVNSGGKTSLLDLLAVILILAHMGLPVPADAAEVERLDALYYFEQSRGTLDAGAFEATLEQLGGMATTNERKVVLVDELESITEPGASAKIIAGILEALHADGTTAVFVSHMAREIREMADFEVPIDGIEAVGLEEGELVVDRSPVKDHLARSTPELIVEKLASEDETGFYDALLAKFTDD